MKKTKKELFELEILMPESIGELQSRGGIPVPDSINEWQDIIDRRLFVNEIVTSDIVGYIGYYIEKWNREDDFLELEGSDRKPITILINTDGGALEETLFICDVMAMSKTKIITRVQAKAYSAGGMFLIAGHERQCTSSSTFLLHSGNVGAQGNLHSVLDTMDFVKKTELLVKKFFLENTKIPEELYDKNYTKEWYLTSSEMLEYGIVDKILGGI
jgi:ATP-dependent protease ClpP protease subunit